QAAGRPADFRSDQFSLGAILYEMLSGRRAFQKGTAVETLSAIIQEDPEPIGDLDPRVPVPLRWIVERCLQKDPEDRYASTKDLARDLVKVREHVSLATGERAAVVAPGRARRRPVLVAAAALGLAVLAYLLGRRAAPGEAPAFRQLTFRRGAILTARF